MPIGSDNHLSVTGKFAKFGWLRRGQRRKTSVSVVQPFDQSAVTGLTFPADHFGDLFRTSAHFRFDSIMINRAVMQA